MLAIYFFGSAKVWLLPQVAAHYQDEAAVILMARHEALLHKNEQGHVMILPEF